MAVYTPMLPDTEPSIVLEFRLAEVHQLLSSNWAILPACDSVDMSFHRLGGKKERQSSWNTDLWPRINLINTIVFSVDQIKLR